MPPQAFSLAEEQKLREVNLLDFTRQLPLRSRQSCGITAHQIGRPFYVPRTVILLFQHSKERGIFQPVRLFGTELFKSARSSDPPGLWKLSQALSTKLRLNVITPLIIDKCRRERRRRAFAFLQQSLFNEPVGADQKSVAGERR